MRPSGALKLRSAPAGQRVGGGAKDATPSPSRMMISLHVMSSSRQRRSDCVFPPLDVRLLPTSTVLFL